MSHMYIKDFVFGATVSDCYIFQDFRVGTTRNATKFLDVTLKYNSGTISAKLWDCCESIGAKDVGGIVLIEGSVGQYQEHLQIKLTQIKSVNTNEVESLGCDISALVPVAPIDVDDAILYLDWIIYSIEDEHYKVICQEMLNRYCEELKYYPAAKSVHHSFRSGLLMHTTNMLYLAEYIAKLYDEEINHDLLLAGVLLHDFGKVKEFTISELGLVTDYSTVGQLMGHSTICAEEIAEVGKLLDVPEDKVLLLKHLILSHHGQPDFGAAVKPMCIEAEFLSCIDMIDSRVEIYAEATATLSAGEFTPRIYALDKRVFKHG